MLSDRCVAVHLPIGAEHELTGIVDVLHMTAYMSPEGEREGGPVRDPCRDVRHRREVPHPAPRLGRRDRREPDGALPRGRGARHRGSRTRAQGRRHARRALPGRVRSGVEEPRDDRSPRPARRGRPVAGQAAARSRSGWRGHGRIRLQDGRRPVRGADQPLPRPLGHDLLRRDARQPPLAREGARRRPARLAGQRARASQGVRPRRHRRGGEAEGDDDRRPPARLRARDRDAEARLPRTGHELRRHAQGEGRRGEGGHLAAAPLRGGPDTQPAPRPADRRAAPLRDEPDPRRGRGRPAQGPLRRRRGAAPAAGPVPGDDPQGVARAAPLQEADGRPRPVRRLRDRARAAAPSARDTSSWTRSSAA